jgi:hypothetical protein
MEKHIQRFYKKFKYLIISSFANTYLYCTKIPLNIHKFYLLE